MALSVSFDPFMLRGVVVYATDLMKTIAHGEQISDWYPVGVGIVLCLIAAVVVFLVMRRSAMSHSEVKKAKKEAPNKPFVGMKLKLNIDDIR
jgi:hypothetical protein